MDRAFPEGGRDATTEKRDATTEKRDATTEQARRNNGTTEQRNSGTTEQRNKRDATTEKFEDMIRFG